MSLFSRYCDTDDGRLALYYCMPTRVFGATCGHAGEGFVTLDTPRTRRGGPFVDFVKIGNSLMRRGMSTVRLGIAQAGRVQVNVYDVAGRKVRTLADRIFPAGEQTLTWDGTDDGGQKVARGVYFARSSTQKDPGRIIVLNN